MITRIIEPETANECWIGEIWLIDENQDSHLFETIVDPDEIMFAYWLDYHVDKVMKCIKNSEDSDVWFCYEDSISHG